MCDLWRGKDEQKPTSVCTRAGVRLEIHSHRAPVLSLLVLGSEQEMLDGVFFHFPPMLLLYQVQSQRGSWGSAGREVPAAHQDTEP